MGCFREATLKKVDSCLPTPLGDREITTYLPRSRIHFRRWMRGLELLLAASVYVDLFGSRKMKMLGILISAVATLSLSIGSTGPAAAQVNMQYSGQANGQYSGQYGGQYSGQFSGQYHGRGSSDQTASPNARDERNGLLGYPVNSGECGELFYPQPGTDYVFHDRQGRRCY